MSALLINLPWENMGIEGVIYIPKLHFKKKTFYFYVKGRDTERREKERLMFVQLIHSPNGCHGWTEPSSAALLGQKEGAGLELEQLGLELALKFDGRIPGRSLPYYVSTTTF